MHCHAHGTWHCGHRSCHRWYHDRGYTFFGITPIYDLGDIPVAEIDLGGGVELVVEADGDVDVVYGGGGCDNDYGW